MKILAVVVLVPVVLIAALVLFSDPEDPKVDGQAASNGNTSTLNYGQVFDVTTMDPAAAYDNISWRVTRNVYDTLVYDKIPSKDVIPGFAESWTIEKDNSVFTFKLREGVKFTDGTPVDAEAVKFSFERTLKINKGPAVFISAIKSIDAPDPTTVRFTLAHPDLFFLQKTTKIGIVSPTAARENAKGDDQGEDWLRSHVVGSGPYKLKQFSPGEQVVIDKNPDYWGGWDGPHVDTVVMRLLDTAGSARQLLTRGDLDMASNMPLTDALALKDQPGMKFMTADQNFLGMLVLNTSKGVMKDPRVRQAVTLAYPFEQTTKDAYHGYAKVPNGPVPSGMFGWDESLPQFKQDIPRAKELLAEAGHANGGFTLTAAVLGASVDQRNQALLLQEGLSQIGVKLNIQQLAFPAMVALMDDPKTAVDISANGLGAYSIDPIVYLEQMYAGYNIGRGTLQFTYLRDKEIDRTLKAAAVAPTAEEAETLVKKAQGLIRNAWAGIPTAQSQYTDTISDKVKGYVFNPSDYFFIPRFYYLSKG